MDLIEFGQVTTKSRNLIFILESITLMNTGYCLGQSYHCIEVCFIVNNISSPCMFCSINYNG